MYGRGTVISAEQVVPVQSAGWRHVGAPPPEDCTAWRNCSGCTRPGGQTIPPEFIEGGSPDGQALAFVGGGQGAYVQEVTYKFVGAGAGEFELEPPSRSNLVQKAVLAVVLAGGILVLFGIMCLCLGSAVRPPCTDCPDTTTRSPGRHDYDCQAGFENWEKGWSPEKKRWCCKLVGLACPQDAALAPPVPPTIPPPPDPYNCSSDFDNWIAVWSTAKQAWCCKHRGRACPPAPPSPAPAPPSPSLPAHSGVSRSQHGQPMSPAPSRPWRPQSQLQPFDCTAGWSNWRAGWSEEKKTWCCQYAGTGCAPGAAK